MQLAIQGYSLSCRLEMTSKNCCGIEDLGKHEHVLHLLSSPLKIFLFVDFLVKKYCLAVLLHSFFDLSLIIPLETREQNISQHQERYKLLMYSIVLIFLYV